MLERFIEKRTIIISPKNISSINR